MIKQAILYSDRPIEEVKEIGGHRYKYIEYGQRVIILSWLYSDVPQATAHLEKLADRLGEGMGVHTYWDSELVPYGTSRHGQFFIAHKKGHDHYIFELSNETRPFSIDWNTDESGVDLFKRL